MKYIGLMSGTSLDGLDIAYCSIDGFYTSTNVQLLAYKEVKMPKQLKEKIQFACNKEGAHTDDICSLNFELGTWFGESTKQFMDENAIRCDDVDAICPVNGNTTPSCHKSYDLVPRNRTAAF